MVTTAHVEAIKTPNTAPQGTRLLEGFSPEQSKTHVENFLVAVTAEIQNTDPGDLLFVIPLVGGISPWTLIKRAMPDYPFERASIAFVAKDDSSTITNPRQHEYAISKVVNPNGASKAIAADDVADTLWLWSEAKRLTLVQTGISDMKLFPVTRKASTNPANYTGYVAPAFPVEADGRDPWVLNSFGMDSGKFPYATHGSRSTLITALERMSAVPLVGMPDDIDEYISFLEQNTLFEGLYRDPLFLIIMTLERMNTETKFSYLTSNPQLVLGL